MRLIFWNIYEKIALRNPTFKYKEGLGSKEKEAAMITFGRNLLIKKCNIYYPNPTSKVAGFKIGDLQFGRRNLKFEDRWLQTRPDNYLESMARCLSEKERRTFLKAVEFEFKEVRYFTSLIVSSVDDRDKVCSIITTTK